MKTEWLVRKGLSVALALLVSVPVWGFTSAKLNVDMEELEGQADEVVEVNLEGKSLEQGSKLLAIRDGISGSFKSLLGGLTGVYRKTFRFAGGKTYESDSVRHIHEKMAKEGWSKMVDVQDIQKKEGVTIYSYSEDAGVKGVTVIATDPGEVTVVNIVGQEVDLEALAEIGEKLGLPAMKVATTELGKQKVALPPAPKK